MSAKPVEKCIDANLIHVWVPENLRRRIGIAKAWAIIKKEFCAAVVARGVCPIDCQRCQPEIIDLFRLEKATKPEALLTWLAKDHSARWIEKLIAEQKATELFPALETAQMYQNLFPQREEIDLFQELKKEYD